ncbi:MAG: serine hydrolase [Ignavibacteria bacterium]|nr:serine hydrolase [Ignavibacteria bacterium]
MKNLISLLLLTVIAVYYSSASGNTHNSKIAENIDNLMIWEEKFGFSGSVLVERGGEIILNKGYGYANKKNVFYNTPQTYYYIASVSKPVTALGVMKLVEQNRIDLKSPITKYFTGVPEDKKNITIEMLLTHTSGLEHTYSCDDISDRGLAIEKILKETPMVAKPGEKYNYSGDNYTLLAALIEIVSGREFEYFITDNVLKPAGIDHQAFTGNINLINEEEIASPALNSPYKSLKDIQGTWGRKGRAGLILSVEDLYKLDNAFTSNEILPVKYVKDILSPKIKNAAGENYGYGFSLAETIRNTKVFGHDGDDDQVGHNTVYLNFPEEETKIFIASNNSSDGSYSGTSGSAVISSMLQRLLFESGYTYSEDKLFYNEFAKYSVKSVESLEGVYKAGNTEYHVWINNKGQLIASPVGEDLNKTFGNNEVYSEKNSLTKTILDETIRQGYNTLKIYSEDNASYEKNKSSFSSLIKSLTEKNGVIEKIEILGTANIWSGNYQSDIATWFKLYFKDKERLYRMEWTGNDKIAGLGGGRILYPMMFILNPIAGNEFIGFDPANGRAIAVNFLTFDKENRNMMELNISGKKPLMLSNSGNQNALPKRSAGEYIYNIIITEGISPAVRTASEIKENPGRFSIEEDELNSFGYKLMNENRINEAISMFTIMVDAFPESANGYDSLGEAYMNAGKTAEAVRNYKRSLELDPKNENARKMIEKLK